LIVNVRRYIDLQTKPNTTNYEADLRMLVDYIYSLNLDFLYF